MIEKNQSAVKYKVFDAMSINSIDEALVEAIKFFSVINTVIIAHSIASQRGRGSNYAYGASKAFINVYLQGLQNKPFKQNINFLTS